MAHIKSLVFSRWNTRQVFSSSLNGFCRLACLCMLAWVYFFCLIFSPSLPLSPHLSLSLSLSPSLFQTLQSSLSHPSYSLYVSLLFPPPLHPSLTLSLSLSLSLFLSILLFFSLTVIHLSISVSFSASLSLTLNIYIIYIIYKPLFLSDPIIFIYSSPSLSLFLSPFLSLSLSLSLSLLFSSLRVFLQPFLLLPNIHWLNCSMPLIVVYQISNNWIIKSRGWLIKCTTRYNPLPKHLKPTDKNTRHIQLHVNKIGNNRICLPFPLQDLTKYLTNEIRHLPPHLHGSVPHCRLPE